MTYDEFDVAAKLLYRGKPLRLPDVPPSADEILLEDGHLLLAGFLLKRQADGVNSTSKDGQNVLQLHFRPVRKRGKPGTDFDPRSALTPASQASRASIWGDQPESYVLGSYRIATAPEGSSCRLTSFKSTCFDSPASSVGAWPASLGCTTSSYSSINPSSANVAYPAKQEGIRLRGGLGRVTMQVFIRDHRAVIAASVQSNVDGYRRGRIAQACHDQSWIAAATSFPGRTIHRARAGLGSQRGREIIDNLGAVLRADAQPVARHRVRARCSRFPWFRCWPPPRRDCGKPDMSRATSSRLGPGGSSAACAAAPSMKKAARKGSRRQSCTAHPPILLLRG